MDTQALDGSAIASAATEDEALAVQNPEGCRLAVRTVLRSRSFAKANRLSAFLEYVCRLTIERREAEINEVNIGTNVFERPAHYNASDDTIVRTTARLLRQRLQAYYEGEGCGESIRIDIPRGGYVPTFSRTGLLQTSIQVAEPQSVLRPEALEQAKDEEGTNKASSAGPSRSKPLWRFFQFFAFLIVGAGLGAILATILIAHPDWLHGARSPSDKLWAALFPKDRNTLIVPADTLLQMYVKSTHHNVSIDDYITGDFVRSSDAVPPELAGLFQDYRAKRYTAVTSVALAAELGEIPKPAPERMQVRFARDLQLNDLKQSNAILIGAAQNDPWVQLFRKDLVFHLDWDILNDRWQILNDHPQAGEPTQWPWVRNDPERKSYSQIAFVPNLNGSGSVLILAGTSMAGTQAASEFLFNPQKMDPILKRALRPDGSLGPFEVLLQANLLGNGSINAKIAGVRVHP